MDFSMQDNTSLTEFNEMRHELELTSKLKIQKLIAENKEVNDVIESFKYTKKVKNSIYKRANIEKWIIMTSRRYSRYHCFVIESRVEFRNICKNIVKINRLFLSERLHLFKITKFVHKTDKMLIKLFKKWNLIE